ncbi:hypothetical protein GCM10027075_59730 [Streptomyces heilongjiangensis]
MLRKERRLPEGQTGLSEHALGCRARTPVQRSRSSGCDVVPQAVPDTPVPLTTREAEVALLVTEELGDQRGVAADGS